MKSTSQRYAFIDVMRGIAALWMIETHVMNEFIMPQNKEGWFYDALNISNGFVSVGFIFCAGIGFMIAAERKLNEYRAFSPSFWLYIRRLFFILAAAFLMDTPTMSLQHLLEASPAEIAIFVRTDVLHTIVYSSFTALMFSFIVGNIVRLRYLFAVLATLVFFSSALIWESELYMAFPQAIGALIAPPPISPFPFIPWSGYFFAGAALAGFFFKTNDKKRFAQILGSIVFILCFVLFTLKNTGLSAFEGKKWWAMSPEYFLFRTSGATLLFCLLFLVEDKLKGRFADILRKCGQESLFIYIMQGTIIFTILRDWNMRFMIERQQSILGIAIITLFVTALCITGALLWNSVKKNNPLKAKYILWGFCCIVLLWFFFVPPRLELLKELFF